MPAVRLHPANKYVLFENFQTVSANTESLRIADRGRPQGYPRMTPTRMRELRELANAEPVHRLQQRCKNN